MFGWMLIWLKMLKEGTVKVRLGSSIVKKAKIRHDSDFNLFKSLNLDTPGVLYCGKYYNKVQLSYRWGLMLFKKKNQVRSGLQPISNAKIMYSCGLILLKILKLGTAKARLGSSIAPNAKVKQAWGFNLFKMLK